MKEIDSKKAWEILSKIENSALIDVRTAEEWKFVGVPDLESIKKRVVFISWRMYPDMVINDSFMGRIKCTFVNKGAPLLLLCRSGTRSCEAALAMLQEGYTNCHNIGDGFEGKLSNKYHRNTSNGWKFNNLPWIQH